jgi:hypothetical protein
MTFNNAFCSGDFNGLSIPTTLYDSMKDLLVADSKNGASGNLVTNFKNIFSQSDNLIYLQGACGINFDPFTTDATKWPSLPDLDIFYTFWEEFSQVEQFTTLIEDISLDSIYNQGDEIYFTAFNNFIYFLLKVFFCTKYNNSYPLLTKNSPAQGQLDNWRYFLINSRGVGTLFLPPLCQQGYFNNQKGLALRKRLANDKYLDNWCGCALAKDDTNPYVKSVLLQCEPICNNIDTIPLFYGTSSYVNAPVSDNVVVGFDSYTKAECSATICVIDDINIQTIASKGKGINFDQVCPGCANNPGQCLCYSIGENNFDNMATKDGGGMQNPVNFKTNCPNSLCYVRDINGNLKQIKCNTVNPANTGKDNGNRAGGNYNGDGNINSLQDVYDFGVNDWYFPLAIFIIFIIFFLGVIYVSSYRNKVISKEKIEKEFNSIF